MIFLSKHDNKNFFHAQQILVIKDIEGAGAVVGRV